MDFATLRSTVSTKFHPPPSAPAPVERTGAVPARPESPGRRDPPGATPRLSSPPIGVPFLQAAPRSSSPVPNQAKPPILGWFPEASLNFHQKRTAGLASSPRSPAKRNDTCSALVSGFGGNYPSNPLRPKNARNWIAGNQDSPLKWFCQKSKTQELRVILHFHFCWKEGNPDTKPTHLKPRPINLQNR